MRPKHLLLTKVVRLSSGRYCSNGITNINKMLPLEQLRHDLRYATTYVVPRHTLCHDIRYATTYVTPRPPLRHNLRATT